MKLIADALRNSDGQRTNDFVHDDPKLLMMTFVRKIRTETIHQTYNRLI